jgi:hypothetical protein
MMASLFGMWKLWIGRCEHAATNSESARPLKFDGLLAGRAGKSCNSRQTPAPRKQRNRRQHPPPNRSRPLEASNKQFSRAGEMHSYLPGISTSQQIAQDTLATMADQLPGDEHAEEIYHRSFYSAGCCIGSTSGRRFGTPPHASARPHGIK